MGIARDYRPVCALHHHIAVHHHIEERKTMRIMPGLTFVFSVVLCCALLSGCPKPPPEETAPTAAFRAAPTVGEIPLEVAFTDQSVAGTAAITSWAWDFGDGQTSSAQNPVHTYQDARSYTVALTVASGHGSDTETRQDYITATAPAPPEETAPTAAFGATPTLGEIPLEVAFTDESVAGSAAITSWTWDFGDGQTSSAQNPVHTYQDAQSYTVSLTVVSGHGSDTATRQDYITATAPAQPKEPPVAAFSASDSLAVAPLAVTFTDESIPGSAPIGDWLWDFGDGESSTTQNPEHTYQNPGAYAVSLTVTTEDGADTVTAHDCVLVAGIDPEAGTPGAPVRIVGMDFSTVDAMDIDIYFGETVMPPAEASDHVLTTSTPIVDAGEVAVRVEIAGAVALEGLSFEVLAAPPLEEPPGTVAANAHNDIAAIAASVGTILEAFSAKLGAKEAEAIGEGLEMIDLQVDTLGALLDMTTEEEMAEVDKVLLGSGFADALAGLRLETEKQMEKIAELNARELELWLKDGGAKAWTIPARYRFVFDWLAARLHHSMEYANVALLGLNAASGMVGSPILSAGLTVMDLFAAFLNAVYTIIEATPMQLVKDSLACQVGANNVIATNSYANVVFTGTFKPESNTEQVLFGLFFPKFADRLGLPGAVTSALGALGGSLLAGDGVGLPQIPPETGVPIYTYEFCDDPVDVPLPPRFNSGGIATLDVGRSRITTGDTEGGPLYLWAIQRSYEFKGSFWDPAERPHVKIEWSRGDANVYVKKAGEVAITDPPPPQDPDTGEVEANDDSITVEGSASNTDGSPAANTTVTITVRTGGDGGAGDPGGGATTTVTTTTDADGHFTVDVPLFAGLNVIEISIAIEGATATTSIRVRNRALPTAYCAVFARGDNSMSLIDPRISEEFLRLDGAGVLDAPRDAVFLPDGETMIVLNSYGAEPTYLCSLRLSDLEDIGVISDPLPLGDGLANTIDLTPDGETVLVPYRDGSATEYQVHVIDGRRPTALRLSDTVEIGPFLDHDDYGPRDIASGTADDGRIVALTTVGYYQDGGPSEVVLLDVTNPYDVRPISTVSVRSRGGLIASIPGQPIAVVAGTSFYSDATQQIDTGLDIIDFSDPENPTVLGGFTRADTFGVGFAITPDGATALIADAGDPVNPSNSMVFLDISNPSAIGEITAFSPLPFPGVGSPRIAVSPDGESAVVTSHLSNLAVVIDLSEEPPRVIEPTVETGAYPWGVVFRP